MRGTTWTSRAIAWLMTVVMLVSFVPVSPAVTIALADEETALTVLKEVEVQKILFDGYTVYDAKRPSNGASKTGVSFEGDTMVLENADLTDVGLGTSGGGLKIRLIGENKIGPIHLDAPLWIEGEGSLSLSGDMHGQSLYAENCELSIDGYIHLESGAAFKNVRVSSPRDPQEHPSEIFTGKGGLLIEDSVWRDVSVHNYTSGSYEPYIVRNSDLEFHYSGVNGPMRALFTEGPIEIYGSRFYSETIDSPKAKKDWLGEALWAGSVTAVDSDLTMIQINDACGVMYLPHAPSTFKNCRVELQGNVNSYYNLTVIDSTWNQLGSLETEGTGSTWVNSTVSITGKTREHAILMDADTVFTNSTVNISSPLGKGVHARYGDLYFTNTDLHIDGTSYGVFGLNSGVSIVGGRTDISGEYAVCARGYEQQSGDTTLTATKAAMFVLARKEGNGINGILLGESCQVEEEIPVARLDLSDRQQIETFGKGVSISSPEGELPASLRMAKKRVHITGNGKNSANMVFSERAPGVGMTTDVITGYVLGAEKQVLSWQMEPGLDLIEGSVTVNAQIADYNYENNTLTLTVPEPEGTVRFTVYSGKQGDYDLTVSLQDEMGASAALSSSAISYSALSIGLPTSTARKELSVAGKSIPGAKITLYDNGKKAGSAAVNLAGEFSAVLKLTDTKTNHSIHAQIVDANGKKITTEPVSIVYDPTCAEIASVSITNLIHDDSGATIENTTVIDYENLQKSVPKLMFWPQYPTLTFEMKMSNCLDPLGLGQVHLITANRLGEEIVVPMTYDMGSDSWFGAADYTEFTIPENITVAYTGGNYGMLSFGDTGIPYRVEADGSVRLGDDESAAKITVIGNIIEVTDLNGDGYRLMVLDDTHVSVLSTENEKMGDIEISGDKLIIRTGDQETKAIIGEDEVQIDDLLTGASMILNADMTEMIVKEADGASTRYSAKDNVYRIEYADGTYESWNVSEDGMSGVYTARDGKETKTVIQADQNAISVIGQDTAETIRYDESGLYLTDEHGKETRVELDEQGRIVRIEYPDQLAVTYAYDDEGRLASVTDPMGFTTAYTYDEDGMIASVTDAQGVSAVYSYSEDGLTRIRTLGSNARSEESYDEELLQLTIRNYLPDDAVVSSHVLQYDDEGTAVALTDQAGTWRFAYDALGQLTQIDAPDGSTAAYSYTPNGNLSSKTVDGASVEYASNTLNQITAAGNTAYEYDRAGRLICERSQQGEARYTWNDKHQLIRHAAVDGTVTEYGYDVFGNRSEVTVNGETTRYIWNPCEVDEIIGAILPDGSYVHYVQGNGLEAQITADGAQYYQYDQLGSTIAITDEKGAVLSSYAYNPIGEQIAAQERITTPFMYVGQYGIMTDGNGLLYMRARYVSEGTSSFISPDPENQKYDVNQYRYAENNRIEKVDITGNGYIWIRKVITHTKSFKVLVDDLAKKTADKIKDWIQGSKKLQNEIDDAKKQYDKNKEIIDPDGNTPNTYEPSPNQYDKTKELMDAENKDIGDNLNTYDNTDYPNTNDLDLPKNNTPPNGKTPGNNQGVTPNNYLPTNNINPNPLNIPFGKKPGFVSPEILLTLVSGGLFIPIIADGLKNLIPPGEYNIPLQTPQSFIDNLYDLMDFLDNAALALTVGGLLLSLGGATAPAGAVMLAIAGILEMISLGLLALSFLLQVVNYLDLDLSFNIPAQEGGMNRMGANGPLMSQGIQPAYAALGQPAANIQIEEGPIIKEDGGWRRYITYIITWTEVIWERIWVPDPENPDEPAPDTPDTPEDPGVYDPPYDYVSPPGRVEPGIDPSGFVYELLESNRIPGVTATLYFKETLETPDEEAVVWNAEEYGQVNPLITDAQGKYQWMVGMGWYRVIYEKEGYETASSEWMPVPPVQTEVNIGMVSSLPPKVKQANLWTDYFDIKFDRYVRVDSVNRNTLQFVNSTGSRISGHFEVLDEIYVEGIGPCASEFRLHPMEVLAPNRAITLCVSDLISYAGVKAEPIETQYIVHQRVGEMEIISGDSAETAQSGVLSMRLLNEQGQGMANTALKVESLTEGSLLIQPAEYVTDAQGHISIPYTAVKPGEAFVSVMLAGSDWSKTLQISIRETKIDERYLKLSGQARLWYEQVVATWTDGKDETREIADGYVSAFIAGSDAVRSRLISVPDSEKLMKQLDQWDEEIERLLYRKINGLLTGEELLMMKTALSERVDIAYACGAE